MRGRSQVAGFRLPPNLVASPYLLRLRLLRLLPLVRRFRLKDAVVSVIIWLARFGNNARKGKLGYSEHVKTRLLYTKAI